jgi:hypothetical protein
VTGRDTEITRDKDSSIQTLGLETYACGRPSFSHIVDQYEDTYQVRDIAEEAKDIHFRTLRGAFSAKTTDLATKREVKGLLEYRAWDAAVVRSRSCFNGEVLQF